MPTTSIDPFPPGWKRLSKKVKEAFGWRCAICQQFHQGAGARSRLTVHHIDGRRQNNTKENLIALCVRCHQLMDEEARLYYAQENWQVEMFSEHTYLTTMRKLWQQRLQLDLFQQYSYETPPSLNEGTEVPKVEVKKLSHSKGR